MTETQLGQIWKIVLEEVEPHLSKTVFRTWFFNTRLLKVEPRLAQVAVDNIFARENIKKYAEERMVASLSQQLGFPIVTIEYIVQPKDKTGKKPTAQVIDSLFEEPEPSSNVEYSKEPPLPSNLNPKYTFDSFIVGSKNRLAHAAARAVAEKPGTLYNPLYFYGGVGLGKTHLMQAVGNEVMRREPQKRVIYVSCETFTNEFVASIRGAKPESFKKKYRNVDIFLVDDIQFIGGKDGIQEEFFHTFNSLYQGDKQIIITSDKAPSDIADLEDRLSSRFSSGMIADMQLPDLETRQAILQAKCEEKGINLPDQVLLYIADLVETNIRELEGALNTVVASVSSGQHPATIEGIKLALQAYSHKKPLKKTTFEQIKDIKGPRRQQELVKPRQILMYLLKHELNMTFPTIGREIGGRDHTTAMHSVEKVEKELKKSPEMLDEITRLKELFYTAGK